MRIAEIVGTVTLARAHPSLKGFRFVLGIPQTRAELLAKVPGASEELVIYDDLGAGVGSRIAFSESGEAAAPFYPDKKPIDAYCACLLDSLTITEK